MSDSNTTSIAVKRSTLERLRPLLGTLGLSYDQVLNRILDERERDHRILEPVTA